MVASFLWPDLLFLFGLLLLATNLRIVSLHPSRQQCGQLILRKKEKQREKRKNPPRISLCLELWDKMSISPSPIGWWKPPRASGLLSQGMAVVPWPVSGGQDPGQAGGRRLTCHLQGT